MNNVFIRPFKKEDLGAVGTIEPNLVEFSDAMQQSIEDSGLAVTGTVNGVPIACGGVHPIDDFHGEIWLRLNEWCLRNKKDTLLFLREATQVIENEYPFKQLNVTVKADFKQSVKLVEFLGYERVQEAEHKNQKYYCYAKRVQE